MEPTAACCSNQVICNKQSLRLNPLLSPLILCPAHKSLRVLKIGEEKQALVTRKKQENNNFPLKSAKTTENKGSMTIIVSNG